MFVRRGPAIVLSLVLGAAALFVVPSAAWSDGGNASDVQTARDGCDTGTTSRAKLKVAPVDGNNLRLAITGTVWSEDSDAWDWKLKHNGELAFDGRARGNEDSDLSFRVNRTMFDGYGEDDIVFRAQNARTGEVCRASLSY
ncbi:hypothetical protein ABLE68_19115 [Nocardioides sp. CN2-186]|uniref:hypothetical protein n=1 Tax=Nocardioides tweenelious TaxID=3156607 RepID=UPI0032B457EF